MSNKTSYRLNRLLENKTSSFKRKYFLLSALSGIGISKDSELVSESLCFINTLFNTDGTLPKEENIETLLEKSLRKIGKKNVKKVVKVLKEYNNLVNSSREDYLFEELTSAINLGSFKSKLDNKLKETLEFAISNDINILFESDDKEEKRKNTFDASEFLSPLPTGKESSNLVPKSGNSSKKSTTKKASPSPEFKSQYNRISQEEMELIKPERGMKYNRKLKAIFDHYDWLLKKENIPFIRDELNFYLPTTEAEAVQAAKVAARSDAVKSFSGGHYKYIGENLEGVSKEDKLSIISRYKLIFEDNYEQEDINAAMRKFDIIQQIFFYLNIQQKFINSEIASMKNQSLKKNKERFTNSPSDLTEDEKNRVKVKLMTLIQSIGNNDDLISLSSDTGPSEAELIKLLNEAAGSQKSNVKSYLELLRSQYPEKPNVSEPEYMSGEELKLYFDDLYDYKYKEWSEDREEMIAGGKDESGEYVYSTAEQAAVYSAKKSKLEKEYLENRDVRKVKPRIAIDFIKKHAFANKVVTAFEAKKSRGEELDERQKKSLDSANRWLDTYKNITLQLDITETKRAEYEKMLDIAYDLDELDVETGRLSKEEWSKYGEDGFDFEKALSQRDIANLSQGAFKDSNAVRQDMIKAWFKALFFNTDVEKKSEIYAVLGNKYIDAIRSLNLMDEVVSRDAQISEKDESAKKAFLEIERLLTNPAIMRDYFSQSAYALEDKMGELFDEDDIEDIDEMVMGMTSYRVFITWFLKDFYANNIWNKAEAQLAYAIKEFFDLNYSNLNIGKDLQIGQQSRQVKKEQGKDLFNPIIYWVMGRTGIKEKGNVINKPSVELNQRKDYFIEKMPKVIEKYNTSGKGIPLNNFDESDIEKLMDDCLSKNGIIGSVWESLSFLSEEDMNTFKKYISGKSDDFYQLMFVKSAMLREYYADVMKNPSTALGNPTEIKGITHGAGSDSPIDKGKPISIKGSPYLLKIYKEITGKEGLKDTGNYMSDMAKARKEMYTDYSYLEDDSLLEVMYNDSTSGKKIEAEIDDVNLVYKDNKIDIEPNKSTITIIFVDPTSGDDKTITTSIKNVSPMV